MQYTHTHSHFCDIDKLKNKHFNFKFVKFVYDSSNCVCVCMCNAHIQSKLFAPLLSSIHICIYVLKNSFLLDLRVNLSYMLVMLFHTEISLENYMSHCVCVYMNFRSFDYIARSFALRRHCGQKHPVSAWWHIRRRRRRRWGALIHIKLEPLTN